MHVQSSTILIEINYVLQIRILAEVYNEMC